VEDGKRKFGFLHFFTFLFEKVQRRESLLMNKTKISFPFPRQREEEKVGEIYRIATKKKLYCSAYDAIIRIVCVCVCIHLI
jgi:hypothetical protein